MVARSLWDLLEEPAARCVGHHRKGERGVVGGTGRRSDGSLGAFALDVLQSP
jgi:hypothetical protein